MSTARTFTFLKKIATAAAVAMVALGAVFPVSLNAQTQPQGWPEGAPLSAPRGSSTALNAAEVSYFRDQLIIAEAAGRISTEKYTTVSESLDFCAGNELCNSATWGGLREEYIQTVLRNAGITPPPLVGSGDPTFPPPGSTDPTVPQEDQGTDYASLNAGEAPSCNFTSGGNFLNCIMSFLGKMVASGLWLLVSLFGWMLGVVGMFFNWVMLVTVFQYATYFGNSEGILLAWSILRDLGNIMLLFGFIFIGLQTILNIGHFSVGKALARLVIFAILINFSLFISGAIVDVSNVFASTFYNIASEGNCTEAASNADCVGYGIAGKVLEAAGISAIFSLDGLQGIGEVWMSHDGMKEMVLYTGLSIFLLIMMVTLAAAAIMFVIRAITLMLLLVVSPLGFAGMAIPQFEEQSSKWWKMLISQSFFAPIYLLFVFIGLKIMEGANETFNVGNASLTTALGNANVSTGGIFILFALMIGFMIAAMTIAKSMGAMGATFAVNTSGKMVGAATLGTAGWIGRRTVGAGMERLGKTVEKKYGTTHPGLSRMVLKATDAGSKASFDARSTKLMKGGAKAGGFELGAPSKTASHGIHGIHEKANKEREEFDKRIPPTDDQNRGAEIAEVELLERKAELKERLKQEDARVRSQEVELEKAIKAGNKDVIEAQRNSLEQAMKERDDQMEKLEVSINGNTVKLTQRIKDLEKRKKDLTGRAQAEKTEQLIKSYEASAHSGLNRGVAFVTRTVGPHADHEAVKRLRAGGKMTDVEKALKTLGEKVKDPEEKPEEPTTPPAAGSAASPPPADHH